MLHHGDRDTSTRMNERRYQMDPWRIRASSTLPDPTMQESIIT